MERISLLSVKEINKMSNIEKEQYFNKLKEYCESLQKQKRKNICHEVITQIYPFLRNYEYEILGQENIPNDGKALFVCNHSNSHDFFTAHDVFKKLGTNVSVFAAKDDIGLATQLLFKSCDAVLIDRNSKVSGVNGLFELSSNLLNGLPGVIFSESTWNLHPFKPMQKIKVGGTNIGAITSLPIIPTIIEYIETPKLCSKESELIEHCMVKFGTPIYVSREQNLIDQTNIIQITLEKMRLNLWKELGIFRQSLSDVNKDLYLNHTYLKKFCAVGFQYDSLNESQYLLSSSNQPVENEYYISENGEFLPGITTKEVGKKYIR